MELPLYVNIKTRKCISVVWVFFSQLLYTNFGTKKFMLSGRALRWPVLKLLPGEGRLRGSDVLPLGRR